MSYAIQFSEQANKSIAIYKKNNPAMFRKLSKLLAEISEHPRHGTGHPEPLTNGKNIRYSRRISASDRIIYDIYDETVLVIILSVGGHYSDK